MNWRQKYAVIRKNKLKCVRTLQSTAFNYQCFPRIVLLLPHPFATLFFKRMLQWTYSTYKLRVCPSNWRPHAHFCRTKRNWRTSKTTIWKIRSCASEEKTLFFKSLFWIYVSSALYGRFDLSGFSCHKKRYHKSNNLGKGISFSPRGDPFSRSLWWIEGTFSCNR
jgi:hypothetical protein